MVICPACEGVKGVDGVESVHSTNRADGGQDAAQTILYTFEEECITFGESYTWWTLRGTERCVQAQKGGRSEQVLRHTVCYASWQATTSQPT